MKITPLEIRQKTFEKKLRGYDKDEVDAFLLSLSNEWERIQDENRELKIKLDQAEKEVEKLREVESSLFKTLKTAEDTGANLIDQATKAAELHLKETQMSSEALLNESKSKARALSERAESQARQIIEEMQDAVRKLEEDYRTIENHKANVITELKNLSANIVERVERASKAKSKFQLEDQMKKVRELARSSQEKINAEKLATKPARPKRPVTLNTSVKQNEPMFKKQVKKKTVPTSPKQAQKPLPPPKSSGTGSGSFFDELENG